MRCDVKRQLTALHVATYFDREELVAMLLQAGADVTATDVVRIILYYHIIISSSIIPP